MKVTPLRIADVKLIEPEVFEDDRGYFFEIFNQKKFNELVDSDVHFVQDNQSKSKRGVIRGMHYQKKPFAQGKLVHVICGEIFDVVVDIVCTKYFSINSCIGRVFFYRVYLRFYFFFF